MWCAIGPAPLVLGSVVQLTVKVNVSVFVEVDVAEDLLQLAFLQLLPQEALHPVLQLLQRDLPIAIAVKLQQVGVRGRGHKEIHES